MNFDIVYSGRSVRRLRGNCCFNIIPRVEAIIPLSDNRKHLLIRSQLIRMSNNPDR